MDALSIPVLEAVAASSAVGRHAPDLALRLRQVLDRRRAGEGTLSAERSAAYRANLAAGGAFELQAFTSDGVQKRSQARIMCVLVCRGPSNYDVLTVLPAAVACLANSC